MCKQIMIIIDRKKWCYLKIIAYVCWKYSLVGWGWVFFHINHCRLFNAKSSLYIYINYI